MCAKRTPARAVRALPAQPNLEHLKNEAKQRLKALRGGNPATKLAEAQLVVARDYGFASWRQLKAHVETASADRPLREKVFAAAQAGDVETVRSALDAGFDPRQMDGEGRTLHQIAKEFGHEAIELLARVIEERDDTPPQLRGAVGSILDAAEKGHADKLGELLDRHPELIDARGGNFQRQTALHKAAWRNQRACVELLLERGANVRIRDTGDNACALHFAAEAADLGIVRMLVDAGADVIGDGDDHRLGVLGWATCFQTTRHDVADYLLAQGAKLNLWSAIALGREDDVSHFIKADPTLLTARMSRSEHRRTPLHHAAAKNQRKIVRLLLELGADPNAADLTGATPLVTAAQDNADDGVASLLLAAGARIDFIAALGLKRYDLAETMLRDNPARIGADGADTIALHLAVSKHNAGTVRWLIDHKVDVNAKRVLWDCNHTALHMTAADGNTEIARMLLDAGADPSIHDDKYDNTPLGWAEFCEQPQIAQLLRQRGVTR
jgi:ankyrin repeat protein